MISVRFAFHYVEIIRILTQSVLGEMDGVSILAFINRDECYEGGNG